MSTCHADRIKALQRVGKAAIRWSHLQTQVERKFMRPGLIDELAETEAECLAAARELARIADCSD